MLLAQGRKSLSATFEHGFSVGANEIYGTIHMR